MGGGMAESLDVLLLGVIAVLTLMLEKVRRDLSENTTITKETKTAANGTLKDALEKLDQEQATSARLRELLQRQQDRLAYLTTKLPDEVLDSFHDQREPCPSCPYRQKTG
jgi:hypothetical protein